MAEITQYGLKLSDILLKRDSVTPISKLEAKVLLNHRQANVFINGEIVSVEHLFSLEEWRKLNVLALKKEQIVLKLEGSPRKGGCWGTVVYNGNSISDTAVTLPALRNKMYRLLNQFHYLTADEIEFKEERMD